MSDTTGDAPDGPARCRATRKDGTPCKAAAWPNGLCFGHQPFDRSESNARGGSNSSKSLRALKLLPARLLPVVEHLEQAFISACENKLVSIDTPASKENAQLIAPLSRALLACVQAGEFEERIRELERQVAENAEAQKWA